VNLSDTLPLTPTQLHLWTSQSISPEDPLLNQIITIELKLNLYNDDNLRRWKSAWNRVVELNPILCATIQTNVNGVPEQKLGHKVPALDIVDLDNFAPMTTTRSSLLEEWIQQRSKRQFVLDETLTDAVLIRQSSTKSTLFLNMHHLIVDAWSMMLIWRDLLSQYTQFGFANEKQGQFSDYVRTIAPANHNTQTSKRTKISTHTMPRRPTYYGYSSHQRTSVSTRQPLALDNAVLKDLSALNSEKRFQQINQNLFEFSLHLTALVIYLHRCSGDEKIGIETPLLGRFDVQWMDTIGNFIEMAYLSVVVSSDLSVYDIYARCRDAIYAILKNATPGMTRHRKSETVHAVLNYITAQNHGQENIGLQKEPAAYTNIQWHHSGHSDSHHPIRLHITNWNRLTVADMALDINHGFFPPSQHERVSQHLKAVYQAISLNPDTKISELELHQKDELWQFSGHVNRESNEGGLLQWVDEVARSNWKAIAVDNGSDTISYAELIGQSDAISQALNKLNVGRESRVAIYLPRCLYFPSALIGILRCGAAFVPIDITQPLIRLTNILDNADIACVITDERHMSQLPSNVRCLAIESMLIESNATVQLPLEPVPNSHTAYIIYTSGSTGTPKGVEISHDALLSYLGWARKYYALNSPVVMPFFTSVSFDLTLTSLLLPLLCGGTIRVFDQKHEYDNLTVLDVVRDFSINTIKLTPSHLSLVKDCDLKNSQVCQLIVGGEDFKSSLAMDIFKLFKHPVRIVNEYGPTEATVGCVVKDWQPEESSRGSVAIGLPIENTNIYIVNESGLPQFLAARRKTV